MISSGYGQTEDYKLNVSSNPTGIDHINSTSIRIYPNPVNDLLNISNSENISSVSIYNMLGQEVLFSKMNTSSGQINVSALPKGIYLVKALVGTTINSFKISKQ
ncbi:MAG: T9SS type A sorting domain-containing protein [Bacteroidetes bacterium]|nr:T9SS type A sorting domain-containing protein [Bacteroidota bacterium]